ncbi:MULTISPECIES: DUF2971 domain-containing protein [unclassified Imperialibacter]|uniref:DUF2971 domain-containing protein n=1 Tax=unclassified Imperialibacter TaxID=2629706 RepID=UPI00125BEE94|nr:MULTISPECIES: DUF2971 domain-containing protein [unclassified Imperialibacter]CAD5253139.1 conserved hypothetical protein [Imperialibacter sp. 75]CAD5285062.1 conserved hypothetical protein [Imperialibacter sp. 89]VVT22993.1 conserved hypothetical protein [Imperialibacter sp. EC-SDR9]
MGEVIYKFFRTNEYLFDTIISNQLYFSSIKQFNDPYDCHLTVGEEIPIESFETHINTLHDKEEDRLKHLKAFKKDPHTYTQRYIDCFNQILNYYGICCFSRTKHELLLWSHYTDSHKGVALGFDYELLKKKYLQFDEVDYDDNPYVFDINDINHSIARTILRKSTNWKYEKEIRFIMERSKSVAFDMSALVEVNFGLRCPKRTCVSIHYLINKLGYKNCKFLESNLNTLKYSLNFSSVDFEALKQEVLNESKEKRFNVNFSFKDLIDG